MTDLTNYPPYEQWHDWTEFDAKAWPTKVEKKYTLVPTSCFNCEAGCGLLCYFNQETGEIDKIEGNPEHPASRGRNCAKGPATLNQVYDPERVMYPMKRVGERGSGRMGTCQLGSRTRGDRRSDPQGDPRRTQQRDHVSRWPPRRDELHQPSAAGMGCRWTQQPHQHLLIECPYWLPVLDGPRPAVG